MGSAVLTRKRYDFTDFGVFSEFVFLLDSYRVQQYTELKWADRVVDEGKMGYSFKRDWEEIRKILTKMARVPVELRYLLKWARYQQLLRFVGNIISTMMFLLFGLTVFFAFGGNRAVYSSLANVIVYLLPVVAGGLILAFVGPPIVARKIYRKLTEYRERNIGQFREWESQLKVVIQNLILSASQQAREGKLKDEGEKEKGSGGLLVQVDDVYRAAWHRIKRLFGGGEGKRREEQGFVFVLFMNDYLGTRLLQKPSLLKKHYTVQLVQSASSENT